MEYVLVFIFELVGIGLRVMQQVSALDQKYPDKKMKEVFAAFWEEDWNTVFISAIVLIFNLAVHFVISVYVVDLTKIEYYYLYAFGGALLLGYAGQYLIYKYLGTAEAFLSKKVEDKLK